MTGEWDHVPRMPNLVAMACLGPLGAPVDSWEYPLKGGGRLCLEVVCQRTTDLTWVGRYECYVLPVGPDGPFYWLQARTLWDAKAEALEIVGGLGLVDSGM